MLRYLSIYIDIHKHSLLSSLSLLNCISLQRGAHAELRIEKTARIKQAKDEAEAEIAQYRNQREQAYQQMLMQASGGSDELSKELQKSTAKAEEAMKFAIAKHGGKVTAAVVKHVVSVQLW